MSEQPVEWDVEADVVVLGSGGAALIAAISAHPAVLVDLRQLLHQQVPDVHEQTG